LHSFPTRRSSDLHELRTPLSVMRTATSVTLEQAQRSESEYRDALTVIDEQARRLTRIVTDMFMLARADAGRRALRANDFFLDELVWECVRAAEVLASAARTRSEEHTSELQSRGHLVCRLLLEKKNDTHPHDQHERSY